mgnify:FL=1
MNKGLLKGYFAIIIVILLVFLIVGSCGNSNHVPGYGNTSKCTICGKPATHSTSKYGFCDEHWEDATR